LDGFNGDIILSITGDLEGSSFIGYGYYDSPIFVYTSELSTIPNDSQFSKSNDGLKIPS